MPVRPPVLVCLPPVVHAEALVGVLHDVAERRRVAVLLTVHQPKHGTFMRLDRVLLLAKGKPGNRCVVHVG